MHIELDLGQNKGRKSVEVDEGTTAEELYLSVRDKIRYECYAVKLDNKIKPLAQELEDGMTVQFVDIRNKHAYLIYQSSLTMLLLATSRDIIGEDVHAEVQAALDDGLYITYDRDIDEDHIAMLYQRMRKMADDDIRIDVQDYHREDGMKLLEEEGQYDKSRLLQNIDADSTIKIYTLEGCSEFCYNYLVPSTGYLKRFELMKYRNGILLRFPQPEDPEKMPPFVDDYIIYNALREQRDWNELMGVRYVADLNDKTRDRESFLTLVQLSEALHDKKIVDIADRITREGKRIILILGPSSSGKTTFARRLIIQLMVNGLKPLYVGTDDYFVEREQTPKDEDGQYDFESIDAVDVKLFNKNMNELLSGREADMPTFDFLTGHKKFGEMVTKLEDGQPIVIEGIHAFNPVLTSEIDDSQKFRIYISPLTQINLDTHNRIPTTDTRIIRRMVRDYRTRGHKAVDTLRQWDKVHENESRNIFPYTSQADVFFNSVHLYEMAVLKKYVEPLLREVDDTEPEYPEAKRLLRELKYFRSVEDDSLINTDSILREFIGGSVFDAAR